MTNKRKKKKKGVSGEQRGEAEAKSSSIDLPYHSPFLFCLLHFSLSSMALASAFGIWPPFVSNFKFRRENSSVLARSSNAQQPQQLSSNGQPSSKEKNAFPGKPEADVVVIGSGIGGLCCAGLLARYNKDVLVLESHDLPGGAAHSFEIKGYKFDSGPSLFSGFQSKGLQANPLAQIMIIHQHKKIALQCLSLRPYGGMRKQSLKVFWMTSSSILFKITNSYFAQVVEVPLPPPLPSWRNTKTRIAAILEDVFIPTEPRIANILGDKFLSTCCEGYRRYLVRWHGRPKTYDLLHDGEVQQSYFSRMQIKQFK